VSNNKPIDQSALLFLYWISTKFITADCVAGLL